MKSKRQDSNSAENVTSGEHRRRLLPAAAGRKNRSREHCSAAGPVQSSFPFRRRWELSDNPCSACCVRSSVSDQPGAYSSRCLHLLVDPLMKIRRLIATACAVAALTYAAAGSAAAQGPAADLFQQRAAGEAAADEEPVDRVPMFETPGLGSRSGSASAAQRSAPTAAEIRQARAQFRAQQRMARIEARKWRGYEPLRPHWNAVPMMSSRYAARRVVHVPVYVPAR